jgi:hypothetical protein
MQMVEEILEGVARSYPSKLIDGQLRDIPRIAFNIRLALNGANPQAMSICDIRTVLHWVRSTGNERAACRRLRR